MNWKQNNETNPTLYRLIVCIGSDCLSAGKRHQTCRVRCTVASGTHAPAPAAGNKNDDPAFIADALVLLKAIEEIGVQSSTYLDSDEMRQKVAEFGKSKDEAQKNKLAVEIYQSNINLYRDAVEKLKTLQVKNQDVVGLRDLWIKKFETDIELFNIQIKEQGKGLTDAQIQEKYKDIYRQNRDLAQDAAEQNMALYKRSR